MPSKPRSIRHDFRGYPMAFTTLVDEFGESDPCGNDLQRVRMAYARRWCGVCGEPLPPGEDIVFVGGEVLPDGWFHDPPMHEECAEFAFQVCPFLAFEGHKGPRRQRPEFLVRWVTDGYSLPFWRRLLNLYRTPKVRANPPRSIEHRRGRKPRPAAE